MKLPSDGDADNPELIILFEIFMSHVAQYPNVSSSNSLQRKMFEKICKNYIIKIITKYYIFSSIVDFCLAKMFKKMNEKGAWSKMENEIFFIYHEGDNVTTSIIFASLLLLTYSSLVWLCWTYASGWLGFSCCCCSASDRVPVPVVLIGWAVVTVL